MRDKMKRRAAASALASVAAMAALAACVELGSGHDGATSGAALYSDYCAACHGVSGKGDGHAAEGQRPRPADLSRLSARNDGTFPELAVLGKIYGYSATSGSPSGPMPEFGPLLEGRTVVVETEPGIFTPTPENLVLLARHVERLQR